jgi:hypothetical protein
MYGIGGNAHVGSCLPGRLARLLEIIIIPTSQRKGILMSSVAWDNEGWENLMPDVLASRPPVSDRRLLYSMDVTQTGLAEELEALMVPPPGYEVRPADAGLLASNVLVHVEDVRPTRPPGSAIRGQTA